MYRIKNVDPWQDTQRKIAAITPISGRILDTATGLGYTAILASRAAESITTIELDFDRGDGFGGTRGIAQGH